MFEIRVMQPNAVHISHSFAFERKVKQKAATAATMKIAEKQNLNANWVFNWLEAYISAWNCCCFNFSLSLPRFLIESDNDNDNAVFALCVAAPKSMK